MPGDLALERVNHQLPVDMTDRAIAFRDGHFGDWRGELDRERDSTTVAAACVVVGLREGLACRWRDWCLVGGRHGDL